jgi:2-methylisocitrate lyase-like PEP mutase family enzyme
MANTPDLSAKAKTFLELHQPGTPVVLPTVWDAWSARLAVDAGAAALTVGSHPVADSVGGADNEGLTLEEMLAQVAVICHAVEVPVSADLESGYGADPARIIAGLLDAGAIGLNVEDTVHSERGRLRSAAEHAELVAALRSAADAAGVHVVVNARTDVLFRKEGAEADRIDRAVETLAAAAEAGADVLYPVGIHDEQTWRRLVEALPRPLNAIARPDVDRLDQLAALGVGRISFGPFLQRSLGDRARELLEDWRLPNRG